MHILAMSGSLRASSTNTRLLRATAALAPEGMVFTIYDGLAQLVGSGKPKSPGEE